MKEKEVVPFENLERTLDKIYREMIHMHYIEEINEDAVKVVKNFSKFAIEIMKKDEELKFFWRGTTGEGGNNHKR